MTMPFMPRQDQLSTQAPDVKPVWVFQNPGIGGTIAEGLDNLAKVLVAREAAAAEAQQAELQRARLEAERMQRDAEARRARELGLGLQAFLTTPDTMQVPDFARSGGVNPFMAAPPGPPVAVPDPTPQIAGLLSPETVPEFMAKVEPARKARQDRLDAAFPKPAAERPDTLTTNQREWQQSLRNRGIDLRNPATFPPGFDADKDWRDWLEKNKPKGTSVTVQAPGGQTMGREYWRERGKVEVEREQEADAFAATAPKYQAFRKNLTGFTAGAGARVRLGIAQLAQGLFPGYNPPAKAAAEQIIKGLAEFTLDGMAKAPTLTPVSDADRSLVADAASGDITDSPATIRRVAAVALRYRAHKLADALAFQEMLAQDPDPQVQRLAMAKVAKYREAWRKYQEQAAILDWEARAPGQEGRPERDFLFEPTDNGDLRARLRLPGE